MNSSQNVGIYRHEDKYYINRHEAFLLKSYLEKSMHPDKNAGANGEYWIRSLYFDTLDNKDFFDKINGFSERGKLRLRIYNMNNKTVKLELKNKRGNYILKESLELDKEHASLLISGISEPLLSYGSQLANKVFLYMHLERLRPILLIDYEREAYTFPFQNIRITIDKNVRASINPRHFYQKEIMMVPVFNDTQYVLEVKYHTILPGFIRSILSNVCPLKTSVSKYCLARKAISI
ncbi:MAG: polyphosphate polymerase domain-containing protein [Christensenellales bacterium]|jgi:hypothetical protein